MSHDEVRFRRNAHHCNPFCLVSSTPRSKFLFPDCHYYHAEDVALQNSGRILVCDKDHQTWMVMAKPHDFCISVAFVRTAALLRRRIWPTRLVGRSVVLLTDSLGGRSRDFLCSDGIHTLTVSVYSYAFLAPASPMASPYSH